RSYGDWSSDVCSSDLIGGLARNMHKSKREAKFHGRTGGAGKTAVFGLLERNKERGKSKVRARVIPESWKDEAREIIREVVEPGTDRKSVVEGKSGDPG